MKKPIVTDKAPTPAGPYSQAIVAGDFIFVAGQRPQNPVTGEIPADIQSQTRYCIENIRAILAQCGAGLEDLVRANVYLSDVKYFAEMNAVYSELIPAPFPARTTVGTGLRGILVEIEVIAYKPQDK